MDLIKLGRGDFRRLRRVVRTHHYLPRILRPHIIATTTSNITKKIYWRVGRCSLDCSNFFEFFRLLFRGELLLYLLVLGTVKFNKHRKRDREPFGLVRQIVQLLSEILYR